MVRSSGKTVAKGLLIAAVALLISGIAGCEAGNDAPTLQFHPAPGGVYTTAGEIVINNAFVLGAPLGDTVPAGSSASLFLSLYNGGAGEDTLVGASAPGYASSVQITDSPVRLPASAAVNMTGPEPSLVLSGLTKPLTNGQSIPLTLDFEHGGSVTLQVPVQAQASYYTSYSTPAAPSPTASTTASASPTASPTP